MTRRRNQTHDPRQLSLFDAMANQIEQIRAENIQDDMREESIPAPAVQTEEEQPAPAVPLRAEQEKEEARQPKPAREEMPFSTNDASPLRNASASTETAIPFTS